MANTDNGEHPPRPYKEAEPIGAVADRLIASFHSQDRISHLKPWPRPHPEELLQILVDILALVFPGYFEYRPGPEPARGELIGILTDIEARLSVLLAAAAGPGHETWSQEVARALIDRIAHLRDTITLDVQAAFDGDPSCNSTDEAILCLPGVYAVAIHRVAHELARLGTPIIPRMMSEIAHRDTGIDIHPSARIGRSFFIDHGGGVVVGETTHIGDHCKLYQGVTLGAKSFRKDERGRIEREPKRHPTLEDYVTVYANATILGGDTVIGAGATIGGDVFVTESVPPGTMVVGPKPEIRQRPNPEKAPVSFQI